MLDPSIHPALRDVLPGDDGLRGRQLFNCRDTHLNDPAARQLMDIAALNPSYDLSIYARGMD